MNATRFVSEKKKLLNWFSFFFLAIKTHLLLFFPLKVSDYHIARHITNVHRFKDSALQPEYTTDQVCSPVAFLLILSALKLNLQVSNVLFLLFFFHLIFFHKNKKVQRYIRFARSLTPQITPEAKQVMVQQYRKLRQGDASGLRVFFILFFHIHK